MGKTGRNDPCPCGSSKKYKKCCLNEQADFKHTVTFAEPALPAYPYLQQHNTHDLLKTFAALSVLPENHGKYFRLEQLATHSLLAKNNVENIASAKTLKIFLDAEFSSESMEDICTNTFTDQISFIGGDYLIFPGITENAAEILSNQLNAIFHWPGGAIPKGYQLAVRDLVTLGLLLSDSIAKRLGYTRYMDALPEDDLIFVPGNNELLSAIKSAVTFSKAEMNELIAEHQINPDVLSLLIFEPQGVTEDALYHDESPMANYPVMLDGENYIVVEPASIAKAMTAKIWSIAENGKIDDRVFGAYHDMIWNNAQSRLQMLQFHPVRVKGINDTPGVKVNVYQFDRDKIAYVSYIGDYGNTLTKATDDTEKHIAILNADAKYADHQKIIIHTISGIGRTLYRTVPRIAGINSLTIPVFDLDVLWRIGEASALDLWKFSVARNKLINQAKGLMTLVEFIDLYKLFKDKSESFYISDEAPVMLPQILPGYARAWLVKAKQKGDIHSIPFGRGIEQATVIVERKSGSSPIYVHVPDVGNDVLRFAIEGYRQPIWVIPVNRPEVGSSELRSLYFQTTDAITYWLWQIMPDLSPHLAALGDDPIIVNFSLEPSDKFDNLERNFTRKPELSKYFSTEINPDGFSLKIPAEIIAYLYGADNEGERAMVRFLTEGFNKMLADAGHPLVDEKAIEEMIEDRAPLGMKKKFFILDSADNLLLDPSNLAASRHVQEYDVSVVLDSIVPGLGIDCPPIGEIAQKGDRNSLAKKIANEVLMQLLIAKLDQLDYTLLLQRLIGMNESLIRERELLRIHTPTRIACFVTEDQEIETVMTSLGDVNRSIIAIRCLIEQIAAQPPLGAKVPSITDIDEIVAIMDQIISWGSTSDHIHFDLFDISMGILPSLRVGTEKTIYDEVFDPYYHSKTTENVKIAIDTFNQVFPQNENIVGGDIPQKLDAAFVADYGISLTRIAEFIDGLVQIGYQQKTDYAVFLLADLRTEVNQHVTEFSEAEFCSAVEYLSLQNRGRLINIDTKAGYEFIDIMPWRFNRMLSLMRKPLVVTGKAGDANRMVYWGFRQVLASRIYLAEQCQSDRIRVPKGKDAIKKAIGAFADKRGTRLVDNIIKSIKPDGLIIDRDRFIGPSFEFKHTEDIGDLDVLVIDPAKKIVYSLEAKSISESRNIKEMIEEVSKLFGSTSEAGWIEKHMKRDTWLKANLDQLSKKYGIDLTSFKVKSVFITEEDMLTPYLRKMSLPLPFLTRYDLEEHGMDAVRKATNT